MALYHRAVRIVVTVLPGLAILLTVARLGYRYHKRHLGWDDAWATFAVFSAFFLCAGAWITTDVPGVGPFEQPVSVRVAGYYMTTVAFTCMIWSSRISMLCSVLRIIPYIYYYRKWAERSIYLFALLWMAMLVQKIYICERDPTWKIGPRVQCPMNHTYAILEFIYDCIADVILVTLPLRLLCGFTCGMSPCQRKFLGMVFSSSILTTITSVIHCTFMYIHRSGVTAISGYVSASTALLVCNFGIIATWVYKLVTRRECEIQFYGSFSVASSPGIGGWTTNGQTDGIQFRISESTADWHPSSTSRHLSGPSNCTDPEGIRDDPPSPRSQCPSSIKEDSASITQKPSMNSISSSITAVSRTHDNDQVDSGKHRTTVDQGL